MYKSYSDSELFDLLKAGNRDAFAEIYERYWKVMYVHTLKMLGEKDDAQDIVQELFVNLWVKGNDIPFNTNLSGYLYVSARNKIINLIHQRSTRKNSLSFLALSTEAARNTTIEKIVEKELMSVVEKEIQNLPEKMQCIFNLSRKQHLSHKEIADQLSISDKTVKKQIGNAIRLIKPRLNTLTEAC